MAIQHETTIRNGITDYVTGQINVGTTNPNGQLIFETSGDVEVATLNFSATAFGLAVNGVATANTITDDSNATGGTVTKFKIVDRDGTTIITGSVTPLGGGGDIELSSVNVVATEKVSVSNLTYTAPL